MDHTELFNIAGLLELVEAASLDEDITAPVRSELSDAADSLSRAFNMTEAAAGGALTGAQWMDLIGFRADLREGYARSIKPYSRDRYSDAGAMRGAPQSA